MKLRKKLSTKYFVTSQLLILSLGLIFLIGLYYILNIQYQLPTRPFLAGPVTSLPKTLKLNLDHPDDNDLVFQKSILISGITTPNQEVLIYTDTQDKVIKSKNDGTFSLTLDLDQGLNKLTVAVFDETGDSKTAQRIIYYSTEKL